MACPSGKAWEPNNLLYGFGFVRLRLQKIPRAKTGTLRGKRVATQSRKSGWTTHRYDFWLVVFLTLQTSSVYPLGEHQPQFRTVRRVVDGDTLVLENKERVRLIGVDTPETKHPNKPVEYYGKEATAFTKKMVQGKRVRLEFDQANAHVEHKDKYRRTLAYMFLQDGTFLNAEIIKQGYGFAYTRFPFKHMDEFRRYQREAREQKKGLWNQRS